MIFTPPNLSENPQNSNIYELGDQAPLDVLIYEYLAPAVIQYLDQFPELQSTFPEKLIVEALELYTAHHNCQPDATGIIKRLLPKLSVNSLLATLTHQKSNICIGGLRLLAEYPEAISLKPILPALHNTNYRVRDEAIACLQKRSEDLPVQAILPCLQDNNAQVSKKAITALSSPGVRSPLPELLALLDVSAPDVRFAAIQALAQPSLREHMPTVKLVDALGEHHSYKKEEKPTILEVLAIKDPQLAIEHAITALGGSDAKLAMSAFQLLEQIYPTIIPEVIQEATDLFQDGKPERFFRSLSMGFLAETFGDIGQAHPVLIAQLSDLLDWPYWEVRMEAAQALGQLRRNIPDATIRRLLDLRHDPHSRAVRKAADDALAEILSLETGIEDD